MPPLLLQEYCDSGVELVHGRHCIDPELMIHMLIVDYCFGICWQRHLFEKISLNLSYRWFCKLDCDKPISGRSNSSKKSTTGAPATVIRSRHLGTYVLARCITEGHVGDDRYGVEASADACRFHKTGAAEWAPEKITPATE